MVGPDGPAVESDDAAGGSGGRDVTPKQTQLNRRNLLAGIGAGALGLATFAGIPIVTAPTNSYTQYTYAEPEALLRVAWYETYNGDVLEVQNASTETNASVVLDPEESPTYVEDVDGPVISLGNVLPGDEGTLVLGVRAEDAPADVRVFPRLSATDENGVLEPERVAGDATSDLGELQDALFVEVWEDSSPLGGCDGRRGLGDEGVFSGTLQGLSDEYGEDGIELGCLDRGENRCLGLAWYFDATSEDTQTDSVSFDVACEATSCGGD